MPLVRFTENLLRHVECPQKDVDGGTVREVLDAVFGSNQRLRHYVLDDQGALRKHMMVFIDGQLIRDRIALSDPVMASTKIDVMQALSGG